MSTHRMVSNIELMMIMMMMTTIMGMMKVTSRPGYLCIGLRIKCPGSPAGHSHYKPLYCNHVER